jgi:hypothetical protein
MATRFRKHRTRKMKYRKALKTRKQKGGEWFSKKQTNQKVPPFQMGNSRNLPKFIQEKLRAQRPPIETAKNMRSYFEKLGLGKSPLTNEQLLATKNAQLNAAEKMAAVRKVMIK